MNFEDFDPDEWLKRLDRPKPQDPTEPQKRLTLEQASDAVTVRLKDLIDLHRQIQSACDCPDASDEMREIRNLCAGATNMCLSLADLTIAYACDMAASATRVTRRVESHERRLQQLEGRRGG